MSRAEGILSRLAPDGGNHSREENHFTFKWFRARTFPNTRGEETGVQKIKERDRATTRWRLVFSQFPEKRSAEYTVDLTSVARESCNVYSI